MLKKKTVKPRTAPQLQPHLDRVNNTVYFMRDNQISCGKVQQFSATGDRDRLMVSYTIADEIHNFDCVIFSSDCYDSPTELVYELKKSLTDRLAEKHKNFEA